MEKPNVLYLDKNLVKRNAFEEIDIVVSRSGLFRLEDFFYNLGDYLFDAFVVLFHFQFTSIQIREGIVKHFNKCLDNRDP